MTDADTICPICGSEIADTRKSGAYFTHCWCAKGHQWDRYTPNAEAPVSSPTHGITPGERAAWANGYCEAERHYEGVIDGMQQQLDGANADLASLRTECNGYSIDVDRLQDNLEVLSERYKAATIVNAELQQRNPDIEVERLRATNARQHDELSDLHQLNGVLKFMCESRQVEIDRLADALQSPHDLTP
jgi:hypothetical protein